MTKIRDFNSTLMEYAGNYTTKIDELDANTTYVGKAEFGTFTSEDKWQIKKILISGTVTTISYADGSDSFKFVWDDRNTAYTYS